jgi:putative ABC transport system substrate-binding protein
MGLRRHMRRRDFISLIGGAASLPLAARAQQSTKVRRIGYLATSSQQTVTGLIASFIQGMRDLGYAEGTDFVVDIRSADAKYERLNDLAKELLSLNVDVLMAGTMPAALALRQATNSVPIVVAYSTDPVGTGLVASLGHPGGNVTGLASSADDTSPKQLELLSMIVPRLARVGLLGNPDTVNYSTIRSRMEAAAAKENVSVILGEARRPEDLDRTFAALTSTRAQAVVAAGDAMFFEERNKLTDLALRSRLPSMFPQREYVVAGGLMSYGENLSDFFYRAASFIDKILKGARPADLPVEQPTRFHLVINGRTASVLGLIIPPQLNMFADEVIE